MDRQDHCVGFNPVRKRVLLRQYLYIYNASFCQDRLGTNIGKALKKGLRVSAGADEGDDNVTIDSGGGGG